jgi:Na+/melibiose symporter-like transporter
MGMRRGSRWLGYFIVAIVGGLFAFSGFSVSGSTTSALVGFGALFMVGVLFVLAGFETPLTRRFGWHRIFGLGFAMMGVVNLLTVLFSWTDSGMLYAVATLSLAGLFAFMGFDIARGGPHFEVDPDETV